MTQGDNNEAHSCKTLGTLRVGTPITTISPSLNSPAICSKLSAQRSIIPLFRAISRVDCRLEIPITSLAKPLFRADAARLEPIKPNPITTKRFTTFAGFFFAMELPEILTVIKNYTLFKEQHRGMSPTP